MILFRPDNMVRLFLSAFLLFMVFFFLVHSVTASDVLELIQSLENPDINVRKQAALSLGQLKDKRAVAPLTELLDDENLSVSQSAAKALGQIGDREAVRPLIKRLNDWGMFTVCAEALGAIGDGRAVVPLLHRFSDPDPQIRLAVVKALGSIRDQRVALILSRALKDSNLEVRAAAAEALGNVTDKTVIEPIIKISDKQLHHNIRPHLIKALLRIGSSTVPFLAEALRSPSYSQRHFAGEILAQLRPEGINVLIEALSVDNNNVRLTAVKYLGGTKADDALEPLIHALKDRDYNVQKEAAASLGRLKNNLAVPDLIDVLNILPPPRKVYKGAPVEDFNPVRLAMNQVREQAALALGEIGDQRAVEPLIKTLNDEYSRVAIASAKALGRIGDRRAAGPMIEILNIHTSTRSSAGVEEALGQIGGSEAEQALSQAVLKGNLIALKVLKNMGVARPFFDALGAEKSGIRQQALIVINDMDSVPSLSQRDKDLIIKILDDDNSHNRILAVKALVKFDIMDERTTAELLRIIREGGRGRSYAAQALVKIGTPMIEPMIDFLGDENPHMRSSAAWILGQIGDPRAVDPLIDHMVIDNKAASAALVAIGPGAVAPLIEVLSGKPPKKVVAGRLRTAVRYWLFLDNESQKFFMCQRSLPGLGSRRQMAADILGRIRDPRAVKPLSKTLASEQEIWQLRKTAAEELGKFGPEAVPILIEALESRNEKVQEAAVKVLGELGDERALKPFLRYMGNPKSDVRWAVAKALPKLGPVTLSPLLSSLTDQDWAVRQTAAAALGNLKNPAAVDGLIRTLDDQNRGVSSSVASALGKIGDPRAVEPLIKALSSPEPWLRKAAVKSLGILGDKRAAEPLTKLLRDKDANVRKAAKKALKQLD